MARGFNGLTNNLIGIILKIEMFFSMAEVIYFVTLRRLAMHKYEQTERELTQQELQAHIKNLLQQCEMRSDLNRNETARELGIAPSEVTDLQLYRHYDKSGRAAEMREVNDDTNYWLTGARLKFNPRDLPPDQRINELWQTFLAEHPGLVPTFVPYCLRDKLREPPCYQEGKISVCMRQDHPDCEFVKKIES